MMLKKFLMNMLSSFVGAWLAIVLILVSGTILLVGMVGAGVASGLGSSEQLKSRSVLKLSLNGEIAETENNSAPDVQSLMMGDVSRPQTLNMIVESIREAARNKSISAIYLDCGSVIASTATLNAIRDALIEFKKSSKPIYAYANGYTTGTYFVASVANRIYMNPQGEVEIRGLSSMVPYYKGLLDKLNIRFQVVKVGTFKSAVEPYILNEMSEPARAQMDTLLGNMWEVIRKDICKYRKAVTPDGIDSLVNEVNISFAPSIEAVKSGLVDSLAYGRTMNQKFAAVTGQDPEKVNYVSPSTLVSTAPWTTTYNSKDRIAVLYAVGEIVDNSDKGINFHTLVPVITKLAEDKNVKGMVLRVNSPGGSAYGSAQIGEALDYFMSKGKPLAVSMGDYAASGGYWISACADKIFADPLTITGSIGIFGLIPDFEGLIEKIGVNIEVVSTNPGAQFPSGFKAMDANQLAVVQGYVERGYEEFVGRVAKGRHMSVPAVKRIAEGRVWDAVSAKRIGLVDSLAGLNNAIEWVAQKADIRDKYNVAVYPQREPSLWDMIPESSSMNAAKETVRKVTRPDTDELMMAKVRELLNRHRVQARMADMKVEFAR